MPPWKQTTKLKAKQFLAENEQNTVHIYSCHGVHTAKTLFSVISLFVMEFEIMLGIVRKTYGQFSHSSRDRNLLVQAAVGDNLPQDTVIGSLRSLCFSDSWNRQKQCMNSEGSTKEAKALASSETLEFNRGLFSSPTFQKEFLEYVLIALKPNDCLRVGKVERVPTGTRLAAHCMVAGRLDSAETMMYISIRSVC